jgi:chromosome segregation ATPase
MFALTNTQTALAEKQFKKNKAANQALLDEKDQIISELSARLYALSSERQETERQIAHLKVDAEEKDRTAEARIAALKEVREAQDKEIKERDARINSEFEKVKADSSMHQEEIAALKEAHQSEISAVQAEKDRLKTILHSLKQQVAYFESLNHGQRDRIQQMQNKIRRAQLESSCSGNGLDFYKRKANSLNTILRGS